MRICLVFDRPGPHSPSFHLSFRPHKYSDMLLVCPFLFFLNQNKSIWLLCPHLSHLCVAVTFKKIFLNYSKKHLAFTTFPFRLYLNIFNKLPQDVHGCRTSREDDGRHHRPHGCLHRPRRKPPGEALVLAPCGQLKCPQLTERSQAELVLKWFGAEPYQTFCQDDGHELKPNTTKQELAAEKPRQEKKNGSVSKTGSKVASTAPCSNGTSRPGSMVQEKRPSHPGNQ